mgnify:CR=1 FL=1
MHEFMGGPCLQRRLPLRLHAYPASFSPHPCASFVPFLTQSPQCILTQGISGSDCHPSQDA